MCIIISDIFISDILSFLGHQLTTERFVVIVEFHFPSTENGDPSTAHDSGDKLLLWCNSNEERRFIIMDAETGTVHNDIPCIGHRVLCAAVVGQRIWLGTEVECFI